MTTNRILLAAGSAALLASFAFAQTQQPPQQPQPGSTNPEPIVTGQQPQPEPGSQPGAWRRFGNQQAGYQTPNSTPPYDPQQGPPQGSYQGNMPQGQQPNYNAYPPMAMAPARMTLPAGTWIKIHIDRVLSSDHNHQGDVFTGTLAQPLIVNGFVIAHRGQNISGRVSDAAKAGRVKGTSQLGLELSEVAIADGQQLPVRTQLVEYRGPSSRGGDAGAILTTTGVGAAIGAAVNGGVGAGVGAAAGLVTSTIGVLVTRGRPTVIYPESLLTFKTQDAIPFSTERSNYAFQPAGPTDYSPAGLQQRTTVVARGYPGYYGYGPYWGYPYGYYRGGPFFGGGIYLRGGGFYRRRW